LTELSSIDSGLIPKLEEIGVFSVESLIVKGMNEVKALLPEVDEKKITRIFMEAWRKKGFWFMSAKEYEKTESEREVFTTGSKALDEILGGGIWTWNMAEFYGEQGIGKSQVLQTIASEAIVKGVSTVFIDTEGTCRASRIKEIITKRHIEGVKEPKVNLEEVQKKLTFIQTISTEILFEVIDRLPLTVETKNVKLICIDSLISPLRSEFHGREMLAERQFALARILQKLRTMARVYNLAVAFTNQVVAVPVQSYTGDMFSYKPTGGYVLGHVSEPRVWIRRGGGAKRIARVVDSSWLPERECVFMITDMGAVDVPSRREDKDVA